MACRRFQGTPKTDEMVIATGTEIGGLLCDGLGDGVLIEYPQEDLSFLRVMSFGLLQVRLAMQLVSWSDKYLYRQNTCITMDLKCLLRLPHCCTGTCCMLQLVFSTRAAQRTWSKQRTRSHG